MQQIDIFFIRRKRSGREFTDTPILPFYRRFTRTARRCYRMPPGFARCLHNDFDPGFEQSREVVRHRRRQEAGHFGGCSSATGHIERVQVEFQRFAFDDIAAFAGVEQSHDEIDWCTGIGECAHLVCIPQIETGERQMHFVNMMSHSVSGTVHTDKNIGRITIGISHLAA